MGRASLKHTGEAHGFHFQHLVIGNPQTAIHVADPATLEALDLAAIGPSIEPARAVPAAHHTSVVPALDDATIARASSARRRRTASRPGACVRRPLPTSPRRRLRRSRVELDGDELEVEGRRPPRRPDPAASVTGLAGVIEADFGGPP